MDKKVLYIGTLINSEIEEKYDLSYYSRAADNKKRGIIASLKTCGADVTVVSPVFINNNSFQYFSGQTMEDEELGVTCYIPPIVDVYGLNYVFLGLITTFYTLRLLVTGDYHVTIFYDIQLETAIPALSGRLLTLTPMILEYEDGLFLHDNRVIRWTAKILRPMINPLLDGAICVNGPLETLLKTENTAIVRGFPSVGMPEDLPTSSYQQNEPIVMFAGRLDKVRGVDTFLEVAGSLHAKGKKGVFWVSGYGTDEELQRSKERATTLPQGIRWLGTLPWEEYKVRLVSADVLVNFQDPTHPISEYTFPSKLLDFMASDALVISTDMSDLATCFEDEILVDGETETSLRQTLVAAVWDQEIDQQAYRTNAKEWIRENCSKQDVGRRLLTVIEGATQ